MITNPILPGFHPDPSICRVGEEFYIANSTFQWWPGVRLHHSKDLKNWRPIGYAVTRPSQLDLIGVEDNGGIWAPCLSHWRGVFFLIYTNVRSWTGAYKDAHNFLITAPTIAGPWSDPVYLNSSGFDPSLFHDEDGRKWLVNMQWDHRPGHDPFSGILIQELDIETKKLIGPVLNIFKGTDHGFVEGPHLYHRDKYYYLVTAEGGTGWNHVATIARSRRLFGPYEVMPDNPLVTSRHDVTLPLQRAGHGSFVETRNKKWYFVHLTGRPVMPERRCTLGRETAIQAVDWDEHGWPRLATGGNTPAVEVPEAGLDEHPFDTDSKTADFFDDFDAPKLNNELNTLREIPHDLWLSLSERSGHLRLYGRESLYSKHYQSLVAKRVNHFSVSASTVVEFEPYDFQQMAGLIFYYDTLDHHYLFVSQNERGRILGILTCEAGRNIAYPGVSVALGPGPVYLKGEMRHGDLQFMYSQEKDLWRPVGPLLDATVISDEYGVVGKFTGAFVGICVQDLTGQRCFADFDWFKMEELR